MALRLIGAGLGRTGTHSLKQAVERLLDGPCYHMSELFERDDDIAIWHAAARGGPADLNGMLAGYAATVDWPAAAFWPELREANPDALGAALGAQLARDVVGQLLPDDRPDAVDAGAARGRRLDAAPGADHGHDAEPVHPDFADHDAAVAAYVRNSERVRREVPADLLVEWRPGDGWGPLCRALGVDEPDEPFPHTNTTADFRSQMELDAE